MGKWENVGAFVGVGNGIYLYTKSMGKIRLRVRGTSKPFFPHTHAYMDIGARGIYNIYTAVRRPPTRVITYGAR